MADLVWYLGLHAPVSQMIEKLSLMYDTMASFNILMQNFYDLQQTSTERVSDFVTPSEGVLYVIQQEHLHVLSKTVQKHLRDLFYMGFKNHYKYHCNIL